MKEIELPEENFDDKAAKQIESCILKTQHKLI